MKKKLLSFLLPVGLLFYLVYSVGQRFFGEFPDIVAYPMMIISIIFMMIGLGYNGYCIGKRKNPYEGFTKK